MKHNNSLENIKKYRSSKNILSQKLEDNEHPSKISSNPNFDNIPQSPIKKRDNYCDHNFNGDLNDNDNYQKLCKYNIDILHPFLTN